MCGGNYRPDDHYENADDANGSGWCWFCFTLPLLGLAGFGLSELGAASSNAEENSEPTEGYTAGIIVCTLLVWSLFLYFLFRAGRACWASFWFQREERRRLERAGVALQQVIVEQLTSSRRLEDELESQERDGASEIDGIGDTVYGVRLNGEELQIWVKGCEYFEMEDLNALCKILQSTKGSSYTMRSDGSGGSHFRGDGSDRIRSIDIDLPREVRDQFLSEIRRYDISSESDRTCEGDIYCKGRYLHVVADTIYPDASPATRVKFSPSSRDSSTVDRESERWAEINPSPGAK